MFYAMGFTKEFEETLRSRGIEMPPKDKKIFGHSDILFVVPYKQGIALPSRMYDRSRDVFNKWILHFDHVGSKKLVGDMTLTFEPATMKFRETVDIPSGSTIKEIYGHCENIQ